MSDRGLWIGVALGAPILAITALDAFTDAGDTHPAELARWIVGSAVVVDFLVVPVALLVGRAIRSHRAFRWPLAATATLTLVAWPLLRGYGRNPGNPSLLPRDYGTGLLVAVATVWLLAAVATVAPRVMASPAGGTRRRGAP